MRNGLLEIEFRDGIGDNRWIREMRVETLENDEPFGCNTRAETQKLQFLLTCGRVDNGNKSDIRPDPAEDDDVMVLPVSGVNLRSLIEGGQAPTAA